MTPQFRVWRTSSWSGSGANCVEAGAGSVPVRRVAVRDSKDREGGMLVFDAPDWAAFLASVR